MPFVIFTAPHYSENALRFISATAALPDVRLAVISQETQEALPAALQAKIVGHWHVPDCLNADQLTWAAESLAQRHGRIHRLFAAVEQIQVPIAVARERLNLPGMSVETAQNFRDKARMKNLLHAAGLPCARHALAANEAEAWSFAEEVGYPLVVKPPAGAASQATFRANNSDELRHALNTLNPRPGQEALLEEFMTGAENSFETFSLNGQPLFHSLTHYAPPPLEVLRNPWIQWTILLPREIDDNQYDDIRHAGRRALNVLGMDTGMTHLEWFRRPDGSIAISEVAARPPGAQIMTMIARANDIDANYAWVRLMVYGDFNMPSRKYAVGAAFLRGMGQGHVRAVHGLDAADRTIGHLVTDVKIPYIGQPAATTYEGEGYVILRHPETEVVHQALQQAITTIRVELAE
jgi:biotin carboxylase